MINKETACKKIEELVQRFEEQIASYKKTDYNETQTRRDFIDPFFKALGSEVDTSQGNAGAYREVIHEDRDASIFDQYARNLKQILNCLPA